MSVSLHEFEKALKSLKDAVNLEKTDITRDASIQRFEFCIELAWKTSKKKMGSTLTAPKEVIREMAQNNYIQNINLWLTAIDKRNLSSHTYNEPLAEEVYQFAKDFIPELEQLKTKLNK